VTPAREVFQVRRGRTRSWLDPEHARLESAKLAERIRNRFAGKSAKLITLTYDPARLLPGEADDSRALYRRQQDERHVRRFIDRLGSILRNRGKVRGSGNPLAGRWVRKLEFHASGLIHWHLLLDWGPAIPAAWVREAWGRGHTDIRRVDAKGASYLAKYVAKDQDYPAWLLGERPRSFKVVAVSPGFWQEPTKKRKRSSTRPRSSVYVPIGEILARRRETTEIRYSPTRRKLIRATFADVITGLACAGLTFGPGCTRTWTSVVSGRSLAEGGGGEAAAAPAFSLSLIQEPPTREPGWWVNYEPTRGPRGLTVGRVAA
jgi:hypothetical protein